MYHDVFPRFIRSDLCLKVIKEFQKDPNVVEHRQIIDFSYKDDDFKIPIITDQDVKFMNRLMEDGYDWELVFTDKKLQMNSFVLNRCYFPNVSFLKNSNVYKFESIIPFDLEHCIDALCPISELKKYDSAVKKMDLISYLNAEESKKQFPDEIASKRSNAVFEVLIKLPIPGLSHRKSEDIVSTYYDKDGSWIRVIKMGVPSFIKKESDWSKVHKKEIDGKNVSFYAIPGMMQFKLTKVSENSTKYSQIHGSSLFF